MAGRQFHGSPSLDRFALEFKEVPSGVAPYLSRRCRRSGGRRHELREADHNAQRGDPLDMERPSLRRGDVLVAPDCRA